MATKNPPHSRLYYSVIALLSLASLPLVLATSRHASAANDIQSPAPQNPGAPMTFPIAAKNAPAALPAAIADHTPAYTVPPAPNAVKTMINYFLPTPLVGTLDPKAWGAPLVGPRDQKNGLEDSALKQWNYWDGQIIKAKDGKFHMFASRWDQSKGHNGWLGSSAVHAVSDNLYGPYEDKGLLWPDDQGGKGHNVTALTLPNDEGYAVVISETRPGAVYTSKSLDGPWVMKGLLKIDGQPGWRASNVSIMVRPDGDYEFTQRNGQILISKAATGILGPYKVAAPSVYPKGIPNLEDPCIFYAGGLYHITVNSWSTRKAYLLTSEDGITGWKSRGLAYDPTTTFIKYPDGTVNHWNNMERPGVYIENGNVVAYTFACIDCPKTTDKGNDGHGSKVIVMPFDGAAMDADLKKIIATENAGKAATQPK